MASTAAHHLLSARYVSPSNEAFTISQKLPAPAGEATKERIAYLGALRKATAEVQEQINKELTMRMEDDKAREARGENVTAQAVDEAKEEDNYGEEVVEED